MITSYDKMPFGIYTQILDIIDDKDRSELDKQVAIVGLLDGKTEQEVLDLPIEAFKERTHQLGFLEAPAPDPIPTRPPARIKLGDITLQLVEPEKLNTAQFVDFEQFVRMGHRGYAAILAVFLVPPGKTYGHSGDDDPKGYDVEAVRTAVGDHLTVTQVEAASAFFLKKWRERLSRSLMFLEKKLLRAIRLVRDQSRKEELLEQLLRLRKFGVGLTRS